ncbi:MAG: hypothetical protein A2080_05800 [Ignavibacteria bacterium GWC2_36_12]|nr:MAG: hypothetical protein A2080_05800 [Ignavibacteria bacterium GWC2_36_12]
MLKICMVAHQYYYRDPRVRRYAEALAKDGVRVDVICPRDPKRPKSEYHNNIRIITVPLRRNYKGKGNYISEYLLSFFFYFIKVSILFFRNRYQIIHVHSIPDFLIFTAFFPKIFGAKLILDIKDLMPEVFISKYKVDEKSRIFNILKIQERFSAMFAHTVITANSNFKNNLIKRGITFREITVVNNIADTNIFNRAKFRKHSTEKNQHFTLIYPGTVAPRYGLDVAIRALPFLTKKIPNLKLIIIGTEVEFTKDLRKLGDELNVSGYIQFVPTLPIEEIPGQIIQADVGIYTAISDPHIDIATPTKVIEYAIMGIPIVASRLKILEDLFDPSSIMFFESGNVEEFSNCIVELYNKPFLQSQLVQNADRDFVSKYSWEHEKNKYYNLLNCMLKNGYKLAQ